MNYRVFLKKGFYLFAFFAIFLTILAVSGWLTETSREAWTGVIISYLNFNFGSAIVARGRSQSDKQFYTAFLGGMFLRFLIIFGLLFVLIKYFDFERTVLAVSLITSYMVFLVLEIWIIYQSSMKEGTSE